MASSASLKATMSVIGDGGSRGAGRDSGEPSSEPPGPDRPRARRDNDGAVPGVHRAERQGHSRRGVRAVGPHPAGPNEPMAPTMGAAGRTRPGHRASRSSAAMRAPISR